MKIFKNIINHRDLINSTPRQIDPRLENASFIVETKVFSRDFVFSACRLLISRYMILSKDDLSLWEDDPESFIQEEQTDHWEYHIRGCAEKLFILLLGKHSDILGPFLVETLNSLQQSTDPASILFKESVYCAFAIGSNDLSHFINFDEWIINSLYNESKNNTLE